MGRVTAARLPLRRSIAMVQRMTLAIAGLLVIASALGLLFGPRGWYDADPATRQAFLGQDVATLLLGVPLLLLASRAARHGSTRGLLAWAGTLFYVAYSYFFFVVGGRFSLLFPVHLVLVSLGMYGALALVFAVDHEELAASFDRWTPTRLVASYFALTSLFFGVLWLAMMAGAWARGDSLTPVQRAVIAVDCVVLLPLLTYAAVALARRAAIGYTLAGLLLVKAAATFVTLLLSTAFVVSGGVGVSAGETAAYAVGFVGATALLWAFFKHIDRPVDAVVTSWRVSLWQEER